MNIAVLLSGGVDSSVVVHLLCEQGYRPSLFYIKIGMDGAEFMDCSAEEDWEMASAVARRRDSQGICFLGKINYNDFVRRFLGEREGDIVEWESGKKIGTHRGYWFHTIGQRKGLGLSGGPWFVIRKDIEENVLYVSRGYDTQWQYGREFRMHDFHFITENPWQEAEEVDVTFKIRHTPEFMKGKLVQEGGNYRIISSDNLQGIAPGQFGVVYDEASRICIGSGEICV